MYENQRRNSTQGGAYDVDTLLSADIVRFLPTATAGDVLDYGAGNSPYRPFLRCNRYATADITQNTAGNIEHLIVPGRPLPEADASFDLILLMDVLEHLPDPDAVITELRRLLRPGGRLIVSVPFLYREHETPHDYVRYTPFGLRRLFASHGGAVLRLSKAGNIWYTLYTLFLERGITEGEHITLGIAGRLVNKLARMALPLLRPLLDGTVPDNASIYHHLLLEVGFTEQAL